MSLAWFAVEPTLFQTASFIAFRDLMVQYSGVLAMVSMSIAVILSVRPRWLEKWFGGLDKMYRLHKWFGISALVMAIFHWSMSNAPKWAAGWGLIKRSGHGAHPALANPVAQWLMGFHGAAEFIGEWTFYATTLLIVVALVKWIPYRFFYKTHRLLALAYLALVFHAVVLLKFAYWLSPVGLILAPLMAIATWAAVIVLLRRVAVERQVLGKIVSLQYYLGVRSLEVVIAVAKGWKGHKPGQFAFVTADKSEGAHPYTIASAWNESARHITFIVKELGDHTEHLRQTLNVAEEVKVEGPYGCFTFEDACKDQIWVGGGIGITPFIARMQYLTQQSPRPMQSIHLFHPTAEEDKDALASLAADAAAAGVDLHVLVDKRDGRLNGERIRAAVPGWRQSSIWFCGPMGLGQGLRRDFAAADMDLDKQFHQEFFALR